MSYKAIVENIKNLKWDSLQGPNLRWLMLLSYCAALEFSESLRLTLKMHPDSEGLRKMASEELKTDNLQFGDYKAVGDHSQFLRHFLAKSCLLFCPMPILESMFGYLQAVGSLSKEVRVMSVVSRESELPGIFEKVLATSDSWRGSELEAFHYYLSRHIELDSEEGGHADLLSGFPVDERVADFYTARLNLYRCIPALFD